MSSFCKLSSFPWDHFLVVPLFASMRCDMGATSLTVGWCRFLQILGSYWKFVFVFPVYKVFENVAQKYDVMNDAMSLGIHRLWKDALLHVMHPQPGARLLDVAGGTGKASATAEHAAKSRQHLAPSYPPHLQVTLLSGSWTTSVLSRRSSRGGPCRWDRRRRGGTFLMGIRLGAELRSLRLWSVTSTRRCWKWADSGPTAGGSPQVIYWNSFSPDLDFDTTVRLFGLIEADSSNLCIFRKKKRSLQSQTVF